MEDVFSVFEKCFKSLYYPKCVIEIEIFISLCIISLTIDSVFDGFQKCLTWRFWYGSHNSGKITTQ